jgi:tRNA-specific 2-thiouridylase
MLKPAVKALAKERGLDNAYKKESMGVCFVGEVGMKDFLKEYIETEPGPIIDEETGETLGYHEGAIFYTIGQRHGLNLKAGLPYYVVKKDMAQNIVYVSRNLNSLSLWTDKIQLKDIVIRGDDDGQNLQARIRHRAPLVDASLNRETGELTFAEAQKSLTPGQSVVLYRGDICLGGGIIA